MPIKILIKDYDFGEMVYLLTDPEQIPFEIYHVIATPLGNVFCLFRNGEIIEAYEHQFSKDRDMVKVVGGSDE
jgi:hypothetical protein